MSVAPAWAGGNERGATGSIDAEHIAPGTRVRDIALGFSERNRADFVSRRRAAYSGFQAERRSASARISSSRRRMNGFASFTISSR